MKNSFMRKSLPSGEHEFKYSKKGCCIVCGQLGPTVYWGDIVHRFYFALCSDCCQAIMAIHENKDL